MGALGLRADMKSIGSKPGGLRLERIKASPLWAGDAFRNMHPLLPRLLQPNVASPTLSAFLFEGNRRVPTGIVDGTRNRSADGSGSAPRPTRAPSTCSA